MPLKLKLKAIWKALIPPDEGAADAVEETRRQMRASRRRLNYTDFVLERIDEQIVARSQGRIEEYRARPEL